MVNRIFVDELFHAEVLERRDQREHVRRLKEQLDQAGYHYAISFYGSVEKIDTQEDQYRRIEVMSRRPITERDFYNLDLFFQVAIPEDEYTLWIMTLEGKIWRRYP